MRSLGAVQDCCPSRAVSHTLFGTDPQAHAPAAAPPAAALHPHHLHTQPVQITALPLLAAAGGDSGAAGEASGRRGLRQKESGMEGEGEAPPMAQASGPPFRPSFFSAEPLQTPLTLLH